MEFVPFIWVVWGASMALMAVVSMYSARVARYEEGQIFLADSSSHAKSEQDAIATKVKRIEPVKRTLLALAGATSLLVLAYYILQTIRQF